MAGSNHWFRYTADNGTNYAFYRDLSNSKALVNPTGSSSTTTAACPDFVSGDGTIPTGLIPRFVYAYNQAKPTQKRKFYIGSKTLYDSMTSGATIATAASGGFPAATWIVTRKRGETARIPSATDTGQTD